MKKKQVVAALAICATAFSGLAFAACSDSKDSTKEYTVEYNANGGLFGDGIDKHYEKVKKGGYATGTDDPSNGEREFLGWGLSSTDTTTVTLSTYPITKTTHFYAVWGSDVSTGTYTVTFYNNYEGAQDAIFDSVTVDKGTPVAEPETEPQRADYTFDGWYTAAKDGSKWVFSANVTKNLDLYAHWTEGSQEQAELTKITVTGPTKVSYIAGEKLDLNGLVVTAHYSDGSSKEIKDGYTASPANGAPLTTNDTSVIITYNNKPATVPISVAARAVTKLTKTGELTNIQYVGKPFNPEGLTFTAEYNDGTSAPIDYSDIVFESPSIEDGILTKDGTVTITASYGGVAPKFDITVVMPAAPLHDLYFDANNTAFESYIENLPTTRSVEEDKGTNKPDNPSLTGFTFDGWYKEAACENAWIFSGENADKMGTEDVTLYAKWTAKTYNVTYTLAGDATDPVTNNENPTTYKATDGEIELKDPSRDHYAFNGWYNAANVKVEKLDYSRILNITAADIKLTASWTAETYDIEFEIPESGEYTVAWAKTKPTSYTYGTAKDLPDSTYLTVTTKDGILAPYSFIGWYLKDSGSTATVSTIAKGSSGKKVYVAKIEQATTYKFTYNCGYDHHGDGTTTSIVDIVDGETAENRDLSELNRKGYTFDGWYNTADFDDGDTYDFNTPITAAKEIFAKWTPIEYTVDYSGDGFTTSLPVDYKITDDDTELVAPTLDEGYYFDGWYLDADFEGNAVTTLGEALIAAADSNNKITLYAKTSNKYAIVYNANKPEGVTESTSGMPEKDEVAYGEKVVEQDTTPDLTDYGFLGWYTDAACTVAWDFDTAINSEVGISAENRTLTLYAKWYQKPTDGKYIVGKFGDKNEWDKALKGPNAMDYKAEVIRYATESGKQVAKEWRVSGLTLKEGDEFKFVDYTKKDGVDWDDVYQNANTTTSIKYAVRPGVMTVSLTTGNNPNYTIVTYSGSADYTWSIEFGTNKDGKTYVTCTVDNYIGWRDPAGGDNKPTAAEALEADHWYFAGNFTNWFDQTEAWSTKAAIKDGNRYYFTKVYLKQYDTFKIMNKSGTTQTWLGGKFVSLGTAINLSDTDNIELNTIEDGYYNIVFTNGTTKSIIITEYVEPTVTVNASKPLYEGDTIAQDNLVVTANGSTVKAADYRIIGTPTAVAGDNTIKIVYSGGVFECTVDAIELKVESIKVTKDPTTKWYWAGSTLNTAGLEVTLQYNKSGKTEVISGAALADKFDFAATLVGNSTDPILANVVPVTVTLKEDEEITTSFNVNVVYKATSITATKENKTYFVGDALDTSDIVVTATYGTAEGAPTRTATSACTFTPANGTTLSVNDTSITVKYTQTLPNNCPLTAPVVTCTITGIEVKVPQITAIAVEGNLDDSTYTVGDSFDATGLAFVATYENGKEGTIYANHEGLTFSFGEYANADGMFIKAGTATLTVAYGEVPVTYDETVTVTISNKLTSITVNDSGIVKPHEVGFVVGDKLTATALDGIVVTAHYNEGITGAEDVPAVIPYGTNGYSVSPIVGTELALGENTITVSYLGKTATFTITAVAKELTGITVTGTPALQYRGSKFNANGLTFKAIFNNDEDEEIPYGNITFTSDNINDDGNFVDDGTGFTVKATYNGKYCEFTVDVDNTTMYLVQFVVNVPGSGKVASGMPENQNVQHNHTVEQPTTTPTLKGYTFDGWYKDAACTTAWDFSEAIKGNKDIYAKWVTKTYTIMYSVDGSTTALVNDEYKAYTEGENKNLYPELTLKTPANKTGYDFAGWCFKQDLSDTPIHRMTYARIPADATDTIKLYAKYEEKEYTVSFDLRGGTEGTAFDGQTVKYNKSATEPTATPTRKHWDFLMWYVGDYVEGTTTAYDFETPITENTIIYARWTAYGYTVQYNLDGGTNGASNPATYSAASGEITLEPATKTGYKFKGWKTSAGATVTKLTASMLPDSRANPIVLNADFELIVTHTVTFDLGYDVANRTTTVDVEDGNKVTKPTNPTREGWKFEHWADKDGKEYIFADKNVTDDITLTAVWTQNKVTVTFNNNYGTTPATKTETINQYETAASVKPDDPKREGYDFIGWYDNKNGTGSKYTFTAGVGSDLVLYAKWEKITGGKAVIGSTDERTMYDNSTEYGDAGDLEYKLVDVKLFEGNVISFTIEGIAIKVYVDSYSKGINKPTGLQNSITLTTDGTFSFYLHKRESETNWTVYAEYAEYVAPAEYYLVGDFYGNADYKWSTVNTDLGLVGDKIENVTLKANDKIKLAKPDTDNAILWDGSAMGYDDLTADCKKLPYIDVDNNRNIVILYDGTFTIQIVDGKIEISSDDVVVPDLPTYDKDGLYIGNKLIQEFAAHQNSEVKLMAVQIPQNSTLTFVYGGKVVVPTIKSDCPDKGKFSNWVCAGGGIFDMYYDTSSKQIWIEYKGEYVAPAENLGGLAINGTIVHSFKLNEGGANEVWLGNKDTVIEDETEFTIMYGGANVTSQVSLKKDSIGEIKNGKLIVPAGSFKFYYDYAAKQLYIGGTIDVSKSDPNKSLTYQSTSDNTKAYITGKLNGKSTSFDWQNGYLMTKSGSEWTIRIYLYEGDRIKVRYNGDDGNGGYSKVETGSPAYTHMKSSTIDTGAIEIKAGGAGYYTFYFKGNSMWVTYSAT